ncbi:EPIDERMAL PATTERNING FACTOR-like protein 4 [Zingiber officinale]|uniref:Epidermal patterning factor-like protein n=1 Tax=Zingiber officinale TaxID=94328 RepID=A0A8J5HXS0_ZINOF|nr:EPIDERMAL PATTERNING FACTOR-like protein 4 [Zingiber officinale]KAG6533972.1 hypothetical protein ZIOFF_007851 [Zingiber officinale]
MEWKGSAKTVMTFKMVLLFFLSFCILLVLDLAAGNCSSVSACSVTTIWSGNSNYKAWRRNEAETEEAGGGGSRGSLFVGSGSRPPKCTSRCGTCTPCSPVHVSVPPRQQQKQKKADAAEYYPEAWRCRCGGRLYVP